MEPTPTNTPVPQENFLTKIRSKRVLAPLVVILVLIGTLFTIQQVQKQQEVRKGAFLNGANLVVTPDKTTVNVNDTIVVTLGINSPQYELTAIEAHLNLPTDTFQVTNYNDTGSMFSSDFKVPPSQSGNDYSFVLTNSPTAPKKGSGVVATITLKALKAGSFTINYLPATQITAKGVENQNVIDQISPAQITVQTSQTTVANLSFSGPSIIGQGQTFTVDALLNAQSLNITAAELHFAYPQTTLQLVSIQKGTMLPTVLRDPVITDASGTGTITVGSDATTPATGTGVIAKLTFKALQTQTQPVQVLYSTNTRVSAMGRDDSVVGTLTPYSITVSAVQQPTATPTITPTRVPTATPTPTITPTKAPTATPTMTVSPTLTITSGATSLLLSLKMPAIGNNAQTENVNPSHPTRTVTLDFIDAAGAIDTLSAPLTFNGTRYVGSVPFTKAPTTVGGNAYKIKVRFDNTLKKYLSNDPIAIVPGQQNQTPLMTLIPGDISVNNVLDIFDYNVLVSCYGSRMGSTFCDGHELASDLNDNGSVDGVDYNVLLTSFRDAREGD